MKHIFIFHNSNSTENFPDKIEDKNKTKLSKNTIDNYYMLYKLKLQRNIEMTREYIKLNNIELAEEYLKMAEYDLVELENLPLFLRGLI
jgi:hypothetical protein